MKDKLPTMGRRGLLAGGTAAGAALAATTLLPARPEPQAVAPQALAEPPAKGGGYQLTEHVKQYYASARI